MSEENDSSKIPNGEKIDIDLKTIRNWINKQGHLPNNVDDHLLLRFLHSCDFSLEKTKITIDLFFTLRAGAPEFFSNRDPSHPRLQNALKVADMAPLPHLTPERNQLLMYRLNDPEGDFNMTDAIKMTLMIGDVRMHTDEVIPNGEIPIFDMQGAGLRHLTTIALPSIRKYMMYTQEAHPVRLKQIHVINVPSFWDKVMMLVKPFLKSEIAALIKLHVPGSKTLYDYVPKKLLPEEYGGDLPSITKIKEEWKKKVEENRELFLDESRWKIDESRRVLDKSKGPAAPNIFGTEGSFRTLCID